ncbi:MAG: sugar ABC transporter permease, partial [Candidatus Firestonebacteria bacterium]
MKKRDALTAWGFILPAFLVILVFHLIPTVYAWFISLYNWDNLSPKTFIGLANYSELLKDGDFWRSLFNTAYFALGTIPASIIISIIIALCLNQNIRGLSFYRTVYFLPVITSMNAIAMVWLWIYQPEMGLLNYLLGLFGIASRNWLLDPVWAMPAVILMSIWKNLGYNVLILLV